MSAAPALYNAEWMAERGLNQSSTTTPNYTQQKRHRRLGSETVVGDCATFPAQTLIDATQIERLKHKYPEHPVPFLASILEASGGAAESANVVLDQILNTRSRPPLNSESLPHRKRRRSEDLTILTQPPPSLNPPQPSTSKTDEVLQELGRRIQGVNSVQQACERVRPIIDGLISQSIINKDGEKLRNLLSRTIVNQVAGISTLKSNLQAVTNDRDETKTRLAEMTRLNGDLISQIRKLKDANATLSYYIAASSTTSGFHGGRPGPDVF